MKYAEFNIENSKIEFLNSVFGMESVLLNGTMVSKKFSFSGVQHQLNLHSENFTLKSKYKQFNKGEIELELLKNGSTIERQIVPIDVRQRRYWILIAIAIGFGVYKLLNYLAGFIN
jgi:hypothetical protein